jgi:lysophospholipase L1-like esterase
MHMQGERPALIRPGQFGVEVAADSRRDVFDYHNEALLARRVPIDAVFIGDSITDMWALDAFFEGTSGSIVNRGIGGDRTPYVRRRFAADVLQLHPRLVVVKIGVNNTWDLDEWVDDTRRSPGEIEEGIVRDIAAMVTAARVNGIAVALCSILPTDVPFNGNTAVRNGIIVRANKRLRGLAAEQGATYVDYHSHLVGADGLTLRPGLADDGLHPHLMGYEIMARVLLETLAEAGIGVLKPRRRAG